MHFSGKRWGLALGAMLAAFAVLVAFARPAYAAEPGESGSWNEEYVGAQPLSARGHISEARNSQGLLQVWRGETNNIVWLSLNNGNPFQLRNPDGTSTATYVSPAVIPYGANEWMVFHTGTDNNIYYTIVAANSTWSGQWTAIPYQSTRNAVSATQLGTGSNGVYLVYRSSIDDRIWGTYWNGGSWENAENIGGGTSPSAPSAAWNSESGTINVVARGEDNQVWMTSGFPSTWASWSAQGGYTYTQPMIAADAQTGHMLVSYVDENSYRPYYRAYDAYRNPMGYWSQDITGYQTVYAVTLSVVGAAIYAILTGLNGAIYYKQAYYG
jgi:hypothetical protein